MAILSSLTRSQKEAIGLLQIGTFLEYFDLMLYVHMSILLNELFFPKTDPHTAALLSAFAFCSTWVMRPFGALIFGYIGDNIGRKSTVIMTTLMMAISCIAMASLPTYAQIGISAAIMVTICRVLQGLSSMGEIIGAEMYLTEITKPPYRYPIVALVTVASGLGSSLSLLIASCVISFHLNWRLAFGIGAAIAAIGTLARTRLREIPDFILRKYNKQKKASDVLQKVAPQTIISYFLMECSWPLWFYLTYIHCGSILKQSFGYTAEQVIQHNLIVSFVQIAGFIMLTILCAKIHPFKILRVKQWAAVPIILLYPIILLKAQSPFHILCLQMITIFFPLSSFPSYPVIYMHFPIFKRFTWASLVYALSRALTYLITSFGLVYLTEVWGQYGLWVIMMLVWSGFFWGICHFEKLEQKKETYDSSILSLNQGSGSGDFL